MMTRIYEFTQRHKVIGQILKILMLIALSCLSTFEKIKGFVRDKFNLNTEQARVRELKDKYKGERCFIVCTGPSLTIDDLELIKGEYCFAMNSVNLLYEKTTFRPAFYGCIDEGVFEKMKTLIKQYDTPETKVFISGRLRKHINNDLPKHWYNVANNVAYHTYDRWFKNKFWCKFSDNAVRGTYDMFSVTHFLIQIAVYMGFTEIYLIGADCNQRAGKQIHFVEYGVPDTTIDTARERNICGYMEVKRYCDNHDVKVYNATRGGELEVFERRQLESVLEG